MKRIRRTLGLAVVALSALLIGLSVPVLAASSGYVLQQTLYEYAGNVNFCGESAIVSTADNRSWALSNDANDPCSTTSDTWSAPSGFLGVNAWGYFAGGLCGDTGNYFNEAAAYNFGVGATICGDQGCGEYFTHATQAFWSVPDDSYLSGKEDSPQVSYYC
jgi:type II secretory pathway pseudopilin PulG